MRIQLYEPLPFVPCCDTCGMKLVCDVVNDLCNAEFGLCDDYIPELIIFMTNYEKLLIPRKIRILREMRE